MQSAGRHTVMVSKRHQDFKLAEKLALNEVGIVVPPLANGLIPDQYVPQKAGTVGMTQGERDKLAGIAPGAQVNVPTNITVGGIDDDIQILPSTGSGYSIPAASAIRGGIFTRAMFNKLAGIEDGAEKWRPPTLAEIGLENVNNTADIDKPISTLQAEAINQKEPKISSSSASKYFAGDKAWHDLANDVRSIGLTGLSLLTATPVVNTDGILAAFGKLQAQITAMVATLNNAAKTNISNQFNEITFFQKYIKVEGSATTLAVPITYSAAGNTINLALSNVFEVSTLTGSATITLTGDHYFGQTIQIRIQQDATGNRGCTVVASDGAGMKVSGTIATGANRASWLIITRSRSGNWEGNWFQVPA